VSLDQGVKGARRACDWMAPDTWSVIIRPGVVGYIPNWFCILNLCCVLPCCSLLVVEHLFYLLPLELEWEHPLPAKCKPAESGSTCPSE
jgi:hypothetical protein